MAARGGHNRHLRLVEEAAAGDKAAPESQEPPARSSTGDTPEPPELAARSLRTLLLATVPMYGIGLAWSCQYAKVTPVLQELGLSDEYLGVAWLAGPISGIVVQPLVGTLSDRTRARCGRRRFWMWCGSCGLGVSMLLMAWAPPLGRALGDEGSSTPAALAIAVGSFWAADFFINALQGPSRTLLVDVAPPSQHTLGNGLFSIWDSLGKISGFFVGSFELADTLPFLRDDAGPLFADVRALFVFSCVMLVLAQAVNQITIREPPPAACAGISCAALADPARPLLRSVRSIPAMPTRVRAVFAILFALFFSWFTTWTYLPSYMGVVVFGGSADPDPGPDADALLERYDAGARAYSTGMMFASGVTLLLSLLLPIAVRRLGDGLVFLLAEIVHVAVLFAATRLSDPPLAVANVALLGVPFAAFLVVPYAIVCRAAAATDSRGAYLATMNLFLCLPELCVPLVMTPLLSLTHSHHAPILAAAVSCAAGVLLIWRYLLPREPDAPHRLADADAARVADDQRRESEASASGSTLSSESRAGSVELQLREATGTRTRAAGAASALSRRQGDGLANGAQP